MKTVTRANYVTNGWAVSASLELTARRGSYQMQALLYFCWVMCDEGCQDPFSMLLVTNTPRHMRAWVDTPPTP